MKLETLSQVKARRLPWRIAGDPRGLVADWDSGARHSLKDGEQYVTISGGRIDAIMRHAENPMDVALISLVIG